MKKNIFRYRITLIKQILIFLLLFGSGYIIGELIKHL